MKALLSRNSLLSLVLGGLLVLGGYVALQGIFPEKSSESKTVSSVEEWHRAPSFSLDRLNGETFQLSDHRGSVVVINFWATWCPPCRDEIPEFVELQTEMEGDVRFVGVSLDKGDPDNVRAFAEKLDVNYPVGIDDGEVVEKYGPIPGLPTTFVVDREGNARLQALGKLTMSDLRPVLEPLVEGENLDTVPPTFRVVDQPL